MSDSDVIVRYPKDNKHVDVTGCKKSIATLLLDIADCVWPGWILEEDGRKHYLGYCDQIGDDGIAIARKDYWDTSREKVIEILNVKGIAVREIHDVE